MKVSELKDFLECIDDDVEVRLMTQPNYPLESTVGGVVTDTMIQDAINDHDCREAGIAPHTYPSADDPKVVYILEGRQLGYGKKIAWEAQ